MFFAGGTHSVYSGLPEGAFGNGKWCVTLRSAPGYRSGPVHFLLAKDKVFCLAGKWAAGQWFSISQSSGKKTLAHSTKSV